MLNNKHSIAWRPVIVGMETEASVRVVAVTVEDGERLPDANLFKFKADGAMYLYHTINEELGLSSGTEGRMPYLGNI